MWPVQTDKCLIPFLGKPLLYHNLKSIKENTGISEFVIISNPESQEEISGIAKELGLNFQIAIQGSPKGMDNSLLSAKDLVEGEVLVVNAQDILDPKVFQGVLNLGAEVGMAGLQVKQYFPGGYLKLDGEKVVGIVEKPGEGSEPSEFVKLVVDYFKDGKKLVEYLERSGSARDDVYEVALDQMIKDGLDVKFFQYDGIWIPLKHPWHILDITSYLLKGIGQQISPEAKISDKAIIEGNVVIEEGVKIFEGAVVKGPCYIGRNCIVGNNSMVRESNLEENCVTGFSSDITRSYIGAGSWFHTNYIGDSVIEGDFGMGSGAVLANLRLDGHPVMVGEEHLDTRRTKLGLIAGKGARVGVNASTMPGIRVGANSLVGPGVILKKDLEENKKITVKEESFEVQEHKTVPTSYDQFR